MEMYVNKLFFLYIGNKIQTIHDKSLDFEQKT